MGVFVSVSACFWVCVCAGLGVVVEDTWRGFARACVHGACCVHEHVCAVGEGHMGVHVGGCSCDREAKEVGSVCVVWKGVVLDIFL